MTAVNAPSLGSFTIDPNSMDFAVIQEMAEQGSGYRCIIGLYGQHYIGARVFAQLAPGRRKTIAVSYGDYRYTRPMTDDEYNLALAFDMGWPISKKVTVGFHLNDGSWVASPKKVVKPSDATRKRSGGSKNKSQRSRYRDAMRRFTENKAVA